MGRTAATLVAALLFVPAVAQAASPVPREATLHFNAKATPLTGISYGLDAVDRRPLMFGERTTVRLAAGARTVAYSCPGLASVAQDAGLTFDFEAGKDYELVCRAGQPAQIQVADGC